MFLPDKKSEDVTDRLTKLMVRTVGRLEYCRQQHCHLTTFIGLEQSEIKCISFGRHVRRQ